MLRILLLLPLFGAVVVALLPARNFALLRHTALAATCLVGVFAWSLLGQFDPTQAAIQLYETHAWHERLG